MRRVPETQDAVDVKLEVDAIAGVLVVVVCGSDRVRA